MNNTNFSLNESFDTYPVEISDKFNGNFLIDGYALVKYIFENEYHDFCYGGQYLHLIYLVENMLMQFERIYLSYRVFFLREFLSCEMVEEREEREEFRFLLNVIVMYLRGKDDDRIDFVGVDEFFEYLESSFYSFVLVSNDERYSVSYFIMKCIFSLSAYCVTIEDIHYENNTIYSFLMKDDSDDNNFQVELEELMNLGFDNVMNDYCLNVDDVLKAMFESNGEEFLTKLFVAHQIISKNISLRNHAFNLSTVDDVDAGVIFLMQFKDFFNRSFNPETNMIVDMSDVIFIIQGKLFCKCLSLVTNEEENMLDILGFNENMREHFIARCSCIFSKELKSKVDPNFNYVMEYSSIEQDTSSKHEYLTPMHSEFLAFILENNSYLDPVTTKREDEDILNDDDYHWHSQNLVLAKEWKPKGEKWKTKKNQLMAIKMVLLGSSLVESGEIVRKVIEKGGPKKEKTISKTSQGLIEQNNKIKKENEKKKISERFKNYLIQKFSPDYVLNLNEISRIEFSEMKIFYLLSYITYAKNFYHDSHKIHKTISTIFKILVDLGLYEDREQTPGTVPLKLKVIRFLYELGFCDLADEFIVHWDVKTIFNTLIMQGVLEIKKGKKIPSEKRYLMENFGEYLQRDVTPIRDHRVFFTPDEWQHDLLNLVDDKNSALVVAPTSSGKTFVSYYVMQKILEENDEDMVVFVSPTKSLVNQVSSEVHTRFSKNLKSGKHILGICTRDYSYNSKTCQILVTVPVILEILLLSPANEEWKKKIKYVIFDEIHSIKDASHGALERLLLLINCPFLALSATIGAPEDFHAWLEDVVNYKNAQTNRREKVLLISHQKRFSDIRKYYHQYSSGVNEFTKEHPFHCLTSSSLKRFGFPSTLTLEPLDCVQLYDAMLKAVGDQDEFSIERLNPDIFFDSTFIDRRAVREYEEELKYTLLSWNESNTGKLLVENVLDSFKHDIYEYGHVDQNFLLQLVTKLEECNKFPTLIFHFNRKNIKEFVVLLLDHFEENSGSPKTIIENITKIDEKTGEEYEVISAHTQDMDFNYSFLNEGEYGKMKEIVGDYKSKVRDSYLEESNPVFRALFRGIGMHHAGLRKGYRELVEILFRKKLLKVVFATGTLAYGINMPCRSVVLLGDSTFLGPMNFHQMSGRSGRRGYDLLGEVIFSCIPFNKQKFLLSSSIPPITSRTPFSVSLLLRCLMLVHFTNDKRLTFDNLQRLFQCSLYAHKNANYNSILKSLFRFSVEYLKNEGIINDNCEPLKPALCVSHIFYTEPGNFLLNSILRSKVLDNGVRRRVLLSLLARIFCTVPLPKNFIKRKGTPHKIILGPFKEEIIEVVKDHESRALELFQEFTKSTKELELDAPHCGLTEYIPKEEYLLDSPLRFALNQCPTLSRDPFIAVSKSDDIYSGSDEFVQTSRTDIIDKAYFPAIKSNEKLNAYIIDFFYSTQNLRALERENLIPTGNSYQKLDNFNIILRTIAVSLQRTDPGSYTTLALTGLSAEFNQKLKDALEIQN